eukprot:NODE_185_length_15706_cov_0.275902.p8 type:complete len:154 gc:universal NODE_185_length_15706_cov_0.275902:8033-8494(+)
MFWLLSVFESYCCSFSNVSTNLKSDSKSSDAVSSLSEESDSEELDSEELLVYKTMCFESNFLMFSKARPSTCFDLLIPKALAKSSICFSFCICDVTSVLSSNLMGLSLFPRIFFNNAILLILCSINFGSATLFLRSNGSKCLLESFADKFFCT